MIEFDHTRRRLVGAAGAGLLLAGANSKFAQAAGKREEKKEKEKEVGAVEDLMREQGVIRRGILAYRDMAAKLRANPASLDPELLRRMATMFRAFGEDYHEKKLEEAHIFPTIDKAGGPAAAYVDILVAQHQRARDLTDYILGIAGKGAIGAGDAETLARILDGVELMYEHHAAREDTVVFPAWKDALSARWASCSRRLSTSSSAKTASRMPSRKSRASRKRSGSRILPGSPRRRRRRGDDG